MFSRFQELRERLPAEVPRREVSLDGEVIAIDEDGRITFWELMRRRGVLAYAGRAGRLRVSVMPIHLTSP